MRSTVVNMRQMIFGVMTVVALMVGNAIAGAVTIRSDLTIDNAYLAENPNILSDGFTVTNSATVTWSATNYLPVTGHVTVSAGCSLILNGTFYMQGNDSSSLYFPNSEASGGALVINGTLVCISGGIYKENHGTITNTGVVAVASSGISWGGNGPFHLNLPIDGIVLPCLKDTDTVATTGGAFTPDECANGFVVASGNVTLNNNVMLNNYANITISSGATLTIPAGVTLQTPTVSSITNNGTVVVNENGIVNSSGEFYNNPEGTLNNSGVITFENTFQNYSIIINNNAVTGSIIFNNMGNFQNNSSAIVYNSGAWIWKGAAVFSNNLGAFFINTVGTASLTYTSSSVPINAGTIALANGSQYDVGAGAVSIVANGIAGACADFGFTVVPYLVDTNIIESSATFSPTDCLNGFIVADEATVYVQENISNDVSPSGVMKIGTGATLEIDPACFVNLFPPQTIINNGTINVPVGAALNNIYGTVTNNGICLVQGILDNYGTFNGGFLSLAVGSVARNFNVISQNVANDSQHLNQEASWANVKTLFDSTVIPYFPSTATIGSGQDFIAADCTSGFVVASGVTVTLNDDLTVTSGNVDIAGTLTIASGKTLTIASGASLIKRSGATLTNNGMITMDAGALYQVGSGDATTLGNGNVAAASTALGITVVPRMIDGDVIATSGGAFTPADCVNGFIVAEGDVTLSNELTTNFNNNSSVVKVLSGATFNINASLNLTTATSLTNDGTIIIGPGSILMGANHVWVNNGTMITKASGIFYNNATVDNNGTIAMENGSIWWYGPADQVPVTSGDFANYTTNGANAVPYLTDGAKIGGSGATNTAADCANGFVVEAGAAITFNDDVTVADGGVAIIPSDATFSGAGNLVLAVGAVLNTESAMTTRSAVVFDGDGMLSGTPVPYLIDGDIIASSSGTVTPSECENGFVVAAGATVTMSASVFITSGTAKVGTGATLIVDGCQLQITSGEALANNGVTAFINMAELSADFDDITNTGALAFAEGAVFNAKPVGFSDFFGTGDVNNAQLATLPGAQVPYFTGSSVTIGADVSVDACANGFIVLPGATVTLTEDVTVSSGGFVEIPDDVVLAGAGKLILAAGAILNGVTIDKQGVVIVADLGEETAIEAITYLTHGMTIGGSNGDDPSANDCANGFIIAPNAQVTLSSDVTVADSGLVSIGAGATLTLGGQFFVQGAALINDGTILIEPNSQLSGFNMTNNGIIIGKAEGALWNNAAFSNNGILAIENGLIFTLGNFSSHQVVPGEFTEATGNEGQSYYDAGKAIPYLTGDPVIIGGNTPTYIPADCANGFYVPDNVSVVLAADVTVGASGIVVLPDTATFNGTAKLVLAKGAVFNDTTLTTRSIVTFDDEGHLSGCVPYLVDGAVIGGSGEDDVSAADCASGFIVADGAAVAINDDVTVSAPIYIGNGATLTVSAGKTLLVEAGAAVYVNGASIVNNGDIIAASQSWPTIRDALDDNSSGALVLMLTDGDIVGGNDATIDVDGCAGGFVVEAGASVTVDDNLNINADARVTINDTAALTINPGMTFTNNGYIMVNLNGATLQNNGVFINNGVVQNQRFFIHASTSTFTNNLSGLVFQDSGFSWLIVNEGATVNNSGTIAFSAQAHLARMLQNDTGAQKNFFENTTWYGDILGDTKVVPYVQPGETIDESWSIADCAKGFVVGAGDAAASLNLDGDFILPQNYEIRVLRGATLALNSPLINNGTVTVNGTLTNNSTLTNAGNAGNAGKVNIDGEMVNNGTYVNTSHGLSIIRDGGVLNNGVDGIVNNAGNLLSFNGDLVNTGLFTHTSSMQIARSNVNNSGVIALSVGSRVLPARVSNNTQIIGSFFPDYNDANSQYHLFSGNGIVVPYFTGNTNAVGGENATVTLDSCAKGFVMEAGALATVNENLTVAADGIVKIGTGATLIINSGVTFVNKGSFTNDGSVSNNGVIVASLESLSNFGAGVLPLIDGGSQDAPIIIGLSDDADIAPKACINGFVVAADSVVLVADDLLVRGGTVHVEQGATVVVAAKTIMTFDRGATLNLQNSGRMLMEDSSSVLYLNDCSVYGSVDGSTIKTAGEGNDSGTVIFENVVRLNNKNLTGVQVNTSDLTKAITLGTQESPITLVYRNGARVLVNGCIKVWPKQ